MPLPARTQQWLFLLGLWLLFGGAVGWDLIYDRGTIDKREHERLENLAKVIDENLELQLAATDAALTSIRGDLPFLMAQENAQPLLNQRLRAMANAMAAVRTLQVLDADGTVSASDRGDLVGKNLRARAYFKTAQQNPDSTVLHVLPPFMTSLGDMAMSVSRAILDERGKFVGVIAATLDPAYVSKLLNSVRYAPDMRTALNYGEGEPFLMTHGRISVEGKGAARTGSLDSPRDGGKYLTRVAAATGDEAMIAVRTVRPANVPMDKALEVSVARDSAAVFSAWRRDAYLQGGFLMLLISISAVGLNFFQKRQVADSRAENASNVANLFKSPILGNMIRKFRVSMDGIVGMVNILRRDGITSQQAIRLDAIEASAQNQLGTIDNILDLAQIEAGKFALNETPVAIESLLTNVVLILSKPAAAKGICMRVAAAPLPPQLVGDPARLQQALLNYAANAVRFTDKGSVTLRTVKLDESDAFVRVRFEVRDSGIGIAPEKMPTLFHTVPPDDGATIRKYGGGGLGLVITRHLAALMDGEVGAESRPGEGSTFWFTASLKKKAPGETATPHPALSAEAGPPIRPYRADCGMPFTADGADHREVVAMQMETAMLLDVQMPLANVKPSLRSSALPEAPRAPTLAMAAQAGADDVPVKRIDLDDLTALGALPKR